jgi:hypothetical protein
MLFLIMEIRSSSGASLIAHPMQNENRPVIFHHAGAAPMGVALEGWLKNTLTLSKLWDMMGESSEL